MAATYGPLQEAEEFTLGPPNTVHTPHSVLPLLAQKNRILADLQSTGKIQGHSFRQY